MHTLLKRFIYIFIFLVTALGMWNCSKHETVQSHRGMYYWRTTLDLTTADQHWMDSVGVERMYLRLFDVIEDATNSEFGLRPEATLRIADSTRLQALESRRIEVVPVVYLTAPTIGRLTDDKVQSFAETMLRRIDSFMEQNGLPKSNEVQIDFDWAQSNQQRYFDMLQMMGESLHKEGRTLSTTIRLHQLALPAPPADSGMLMLYNTGNIRDVNETNSILSRESVEPYLRHLDSYSLPLSLALPEFSWNVVFRNGEFAFIAPGLHLQDKEAFEQIDETHYRSLVYQPIPKAASADLQSDQRLYPGDVIRHESYSAELNAEMLQTLSNLRPDIAREIVAFR